MAKTTSKTPRDEAPEPVLPLVESLGLVKQPDGWVVVALQTRGDRVVGKEIIRGPEPKGYALAWLLAEGMRRFFNPTGYAA